MGWSRFAVIAVLGLVAVRAAVACTTFSTEPSDPRDGGPDAPLPTSDGSRPEEDAFVDGSADVELLSCDASGVFCDGFERDPSALLGTWDALELGAEGGTGVTVALTDASSAGGQWSLRAQGKMGAGSLHKGLGPGDVHEVSFFLHVDMLPEDSIVAQLAYANGTGPATGVSVALEKKGIKITEQLLGLDPDASAFNQGSVTAIKPGNWMPVHFRVDATAPQPIATLAIPGATLSLPLKNPLGSPKLFAFGLPYLGNQGKVAVVYLDDVALR